MSITMNDVRAQLDPDEVDYSYAQKLGTDALPFLMDLVKGGDLALASKAALVKGGDLALASKAAYLASLIASDQSTAVLTEAATSQEVVVRIAAASGIRNLPEVEAEKVMKLVSNDPDLGVRKVVLKSVAEFKSPRMAAKLQEMAENDPEPFVRELATSALKAMQEKLK
jgi:HEAT repeat protein